MGDELKIVIGGVEMFGRPGLGPFAIVKDGLDGWDDGLAMRGEKSARPRAHGSYKLPRYRDSRTVTITGIILAGTNGEQEMFGDRLSGLLADGETGRLQVTKGGRTLWADATLDSCSVDPRRGSTWSDFQLQLWCADGRKFGNTKDHTATTAAPAQVSHRGNAGATPTITVTGSMPGGYTITVDGWDYEVTVPLFSHTPHYIDYGTGKLRKGGLIVQDNVGTTNVTTIRPGQKVGFGIYPRTTGTGTAVMALTDTFT